MKLLKFMLEHVCTLEHGEASSIMKLRVKCALTVSRVSSLLHCKRPRSFRCVMFRSLFVCLFLSKGLVFSVSLFSALWLSCSVKHVHVINKTYENMC